MRKFQWPLFVAMAFAQNWKHYSHRLAIDFRTELFIRLDGMTQSGPDPVSEVRDVVHIRPKTACLICAGE
jgi:hypothetical protein